MLYYLEKFCRICIQTGGKLTDIECKDHDSIKFSDKLKECTQMVITRESLSTQICTSCVQKLRVSYQFQNMCKKSTAILQQYLTELLSMSDDITAEKFINSELTVSTATLPKPRRKRVGKDERCSLLKKLLSRITQEQIVHNIHINGLTKLCERIPSVSANTEKVSVNKTSEIVSENLPEGLKSSGLRSLLNFTKNYDFGYNFTLVHGNNLDLTPLERLSQFTKNFFYDHFADYRDTILYGNFDFDSSDDDEDDMFERGNTNEAFIEYKHNVKEEILIVEPDLDFKKENFEDEDEEIDVSYDYDFTSRFVQACYDTGENIKEEFNKIRKDSFIKREYDGFGEKPPEVKGMAENMHVAQNNRLAEIIPIVNSNSASQRDYSHQSDFSFVSPATAHSSYFRQIEFQDGFKKRRTLSPQSVKCRTRGNPFINPQLKDQFQTRNFKCSTCTRRFKSPGYLKAHCSKLKHQFN